MYYIQDINQERVSDTALAGMHWSHDEAQAGRPKICQKVSLQHLIGSTVSHNNSSFVKETGCRPDLSFVMRPLYACQRCVAFNLRMFRLYVYSLCPPYDLSRYRRPFLTQSIIT